jgi:hypothetical protein
VDRSLPLSKWTTTHHVIYVMISCLHGIFKNSPSFQLFGASCRSSYDRQSGVRCCEGSNFYSYLFPFRLCDFIVFVDLSSWMRSDLVFGCTTRVLTILALLTWHSETFDSIVKNRGKSQSYTEIKSLPMTYRDKFSIDALLLSPVTPHVQSVTGAFI